MTSVHIYRNYLRQLLKVLRERGLPVPGRLDDVQNLEKEAGGVVSACKILGPLTQFFEVRRPLSHSVSSVGI